MLATKRSLPIVTASKPWGLYTPILEAQAAKKAEAFPNYAAGSWGPECADELLERDGHAWRKL